jgi:hypothetical protein
VSHPCLHSTERVVKFKIDITQLAPESLDNGFELRRGEGGGVAGVRGQRGGRASVEGQDAVVVEGVLASCSCQPHGTRWHLHGNEKRVLT